jgi:hypothetical protein
VSRIAFAGALVAFASACRSGAGVPAVPAPAARVTGASFHVDAYAPTPACRHGQECRLVLRLFAEGGYHVNPDYPFKFVADAASAAVSTTKPGDFRLEGEKVGALTVSFVGPAVGASTSVAGVFKLSICSAADCRIEEARVAVEVPGT